MTCKLGCSYLLDSLSITASVIFLALHLPSSPACASEETRAGVAFFESKIRPILVQECYSCHSEAALATGKLRGGLLLDNREATRKGGDSGPAVVPGNIAESLLVSALRHESFEMPPKGKLSAAVIKDFEKWIEMGAPDPREGEVKAPAATIDIAAGKNFWAFRPLHSAVPHAEPDDSWSLTVIDRFISQSHRQQLLFPNPLADARILVRRAWFDLLGLPPTPQEMAYWIEKLSALPKEGKADHAGAEMKIHREAWAELIEHLLGSPHYGERWARHWIDVARFAESHGYEQDYDRPHAYHYRDFLIRAFNNDLPYDEFVRWQIAGDELQPDNPQAWMATGFLGGGAFPTQLTETEFESARYDELDDMVATTGVAFLGLSVGCARCHDHKFDPIPSADYYRMAACFTKAIRCEKEFDLEPEANLQRRRLYESTLASLQSQLKAVETEEVPPAFVEWLKRGELSSHTFSPWDILDGKLSSTAKTNFVPQTDGSFLATGKPPAKEVITFETMLEPQTINCFRLEALAHETLPRHGPGRAPNGNFALGNLQITFKASSSDQDKAGVSLKLSDAVATFQQNSAELSVAASIDENETSGWAIDGQIGRDQAAIFRLAEPLRLSAPAEISIKLTFNHPNTQHSIGRMRFSVAAERDLPPTVDGTSPKASVHKALMQLVSILADSPQASIQELQQATTPQATRPQGGTAWEVGLDWFKTTHGPWQAASKRLADHQAAGIPASQTKVLVTSEGLPHLPHHADGRGFPHFYPETYQLRRGDVHQKGEVAEPGFLQVLVSPSASSEQWSQAPGEPSALTTYRRSSLARWITDTEHGAGQLAARVMVNRLWQHHFGTGLVPTPNDFGSSGEPPTHPELLDWLAKDLIAGGWQLKRMHKQIMTSAVYMQSSATGMTEGVSRERDDPTKIDARRARDPHNQFLWRRTPRRLEAEAIRDAMLVVSGRLDSKMFGPGSLDQKMNRRSVYFFIKRSQLIPMMMLFDWPEHLVSIGQRASTTIAPQALMFMNSPQGRSYAEAFAQSVSRDDPIVSVTLAYQRALGRSPTAAELDLACRFLEQQARERNSDFRNKLDLPALADFCQVLISCNEFVYID